jgi:hypothetical protein
MEASTTCHHACLRSSSGAEAKLYPRGGISSCLLGKLLGVVLEPCHGWRSECRDQANGQYLIYVFCTTSISLEDPNKHQAWTTGDGRSPYPTPWDRSPCGEVEGVDGGQHAAKWRSVPGADIPRVHLILTHSKTGLARRRELPVVTRLAVSRKTAPPRSSEPCWYSRAACPRLVRKFFSVPKGRW